MELPDVFDRLRRHDRRARAALISHSADDEGGDGYQQRVLESGDRHRRPGTPAGVVEQRTAIDIVFAGKPIDRMIFELHAEDYTAAQIADILTDAGYPMKEGTVYSRVSRFRDNVES